MYVDNARIPYGRMIMCHMLADSEDELHSMAARIGIRRKWYQGDHYDICLTKRIEAVKLGAIEIDRRRLVEVRRKNRQHRHDQLVQRVE